MPGITQGARTGARILAGPVGSALVRAPAVEQPAGCTADHALSTPLALEVRFLRRKRDVSSSAWLTAGRRSDPQIDDVYVDPRMRL
jgi:hypothetical protein